MLRPVMIFLLPHLIDAVAERTPEHPAIRCLERSLNYGELVSAANCLANVLQKYDVTRHDRVGIYMDKRLEMAISMYGIMKAGAAYVPLDPSAPPERVAFVVRDCGIRVVITAEDKLHKLEAIKALAPALNCAVGVNESTIASLESLSWDQVLAEDDSAPSLRILEQDLAYVIYTSGSTGEPKGIMHTHHSGLSFARWAAHEYSLNQRDCLGNHAPLHFDLSIFDFFAAAAVGATTSIIPEDYTKLPASYSQLIAEQRLSVLFTVPFALIQMSLRGMLEQRDMRALRWIIFGGEPFPVKHLHALMQKLPHVRFDNMYGPAEVNGVTHYTVPTLRGDEVSVPIGKLSRMADALVIDADGQPVAPGQSGELLVRTPTMMQGYWGRADLNRKVFFRCQTLPEYETVYYRTGDLVVMDEDGNFNFLGRMDRQVKVRGYRIELDEVEAVLCAHDSVEEAAAYALPDENGSQRIVAEYTLKQDAELSRNELRRHLMANLPAYAVPAVLTARGAFPRTSTGKIDRRTLRAAALEAGGG